MNTTNLTSQLTIDFCKVEVTINYELFKFIKGNRPIDESHVKRLMKSMQDHYLKRPIDVNENYEIIDGQHRFEAIKRLNLPLYFIKREGEGIKEMQSSNSNNKKWSLKEWVDSQSELGNKDYQAILHFAEKHKINIQHAMHLLDFRAGSSIIKDGSFTVKNIALSEATAVLLKKISKIVAFNCFRRPMVQSFRKLADNSNFNFDVFLKKLEYQSDRFKPCIDSKSQIELIEEIYNYRNQNKVNLRINSK